MTRRSAGRPSINPADPLAMATLADQSELAVKLAGILDGLREYDNNSITGTIWKKPYNGIGAFEWVEEAAPPYDLGRIFSELHRRFGGGSFELRIRAGGKIRGVLPINIAKENTPAAGAPAVVTTGLGGTAELFTMMMNQQQASADRQMEMMLAMNKSSNDLMAAVMAGMAGNRGGRETDIVALIAALRPNNGGMKETLETLQLAKALMAPPEGGGEGGGGFDPDDLVASGARLIGPIAKSLGDYIQQRREGPPPSAYGDGEPPEGSAPPPLALGGAPSRFRIIELVKIDVNYMFQRGHDPEKAADLVYDIIEANNVTEEEVNELAATFALSPTGLDDLAAEGIDLRERPAWAHEFFAALAAIHSGEIDDTGGEGGGTPDTAAHGRPGKEGDARPAH